MKALKPGIVILFGGPHVPDHPEPFMRAHRQIDLAVHNEGERTFLSPVFVPLENAIYRLCGIDPTVEQPWSAYAVSMLLFGVGFPCGRLAQTRLCAGSGRGSGS